GLTLFLPDHSPPQICTLSLHDALPISQQTQFKYIGTKPPRVQGMGVVSNVGWYTENLNRGNQLFMVTLRSPHPHARVRSIDSSEDRKSTRLNSSHLGISYAVFCLKKKT